MRTTHHKLVHSLPGVFVGLKNGRVKLRQSEKAKGTITRINLSFYPDKQC
uniref:Uncharacterized protein n=1 Tax=Anguilla anguilla TaxID=7936 RepID=A0A0E9TUD5_ANGAN